MVAIDARYSDRGDSDRGGLGGSAWPVMGELVLGGLLTCDAEYRGASWSYQGVMTPGTLMRSNTGDKLAKTPRIIEPKPAAAQPLPSWLRARASSAESFEAKGVPQPGPLCQDGKQRLAEKSTE